MDVEDQPETRALHAALRRRSIPRVGCALIVALIIAGCASRAENALTPLGDIALVPGAHRVDMLVATTRQSTNAVPGELFSGERAKEPAYAEVAISIPPDSARKIGEVQWPRSTPGDPAREFVALKSGRLNRDALRLRLKQEASRRQGRVLVFVHGYNNRYDDAVMRFAQFAYDSRAPGAPLLFTWPSRGKLLAYGYDHESASYSRDALESLFDMLNADPSVREIDVIAHSMGNWVTLEALRQSAIRRGRAPAKIKDVMLAAPDVDVDVFRRQIAELGPQRPRLTLFVSRDDQALGFSKRVWGSVARIGAVDPEAEPYKSEFVANKIAVFDLTALSGERGSFNHDKFATSPEIVRLIGGRLAEGQSINDSRVGLGDGIHLLTADTVNVIGGVVGGVVSAPAKMLEGKPPVELE
ncbi:alpha/beta hydrolase [Terrarubrum flagellatum]|uniref:alpha/beta hydrolase n=1 Tax=Terrirubrum flagellatum TaxID=2895980 RepID=UPI0031456DC9